MFSDSLFPLPPPHTLVRPRRLACVRVRAHSLSPPLSRLVLHPLLIVCMSVRACVFSRTRLLRACVRLRVLRARITVTRQHYEVSIILFANALLPPLPLTLTPRISEPTLLPPLSLGPSPALALCMRPVCFSAPQGTSPTCKTSLSPTSS